MRTIKSAYESNIKYIDETVCSRTFVLFPFPYGQVGILVHLCSQLPPSCYIITSRYNVK